LDFFLWCRSLIDPFGTEQGWTDGTDEDGIHGTINMNLIACIFGFESQHFLEGTRLVLFLGFCLRMVLDFWDMRVGLIGRRSGFCLGWQMERSEISSDAVSVLDFCKVALTLLFLRRRQDNVPNITLS
jgi:hypothetical protein